MNRRLSPGKVRRLQSAASAAGVFKILAVDHLDVLLKMMPAEGSGQVLAERVTRLKLDLVDRLAPRSTAVILDPQYSALQAIVCGALPGSIGLLTPLERGPDGGESSPSKRMPPAWSVRQASLAGASGVKLYLPYHPDAGDRTKVQEEFLRNVIQQCEDEAMPLFLEPTLCSIDPGSPIGSARFARQRRRIVVQTAKRLGDLGPDVLKLSFPVDGRFELNEAIWRSACFELGEASSVPWTLLSAGAPFDMFKTQVQVACEFGCSGFMAGRSIWCEAAQAREDERGVLLQRTILPRLQELNQIADCHGQDWRRKYPPSTACWDWPKPC